MTDYLIMALALGLVVYGFYKILPSHWFKEKTCPYDKTIKCEGCKYK